jgi:thiamine-phosphate diphosphorylase
VDAGVELVQIREKDLSGRALEDLVGWAVFLASSRQGGATRIIVNDRLDVALACGAAGVHLPADGIPVSAARRAGPPGFLIGASTHTLDEARRAAADGADYVFFGPVFATASKPGVRPVGVEVLAEVVEKLACPVFALGGMTPQRLGEVASAGAAGVAGISVFSEEDSLREMMKAVRQP